MNESNVSAIITTCNRSEDVLERAIKSVISQTYPVKEVIVINDSPDFASRKKIDLICDKYNAIYYVNEKTMGAGYSRNKGIELSTGEYVAFLDDDDEWIDNKIEKMIRLFEPGVGLVYCDMITRTPRGDSIQLMDEFHEDKVIEMLLDHNYIGGFSAPIISKKHLIEVGMMDENLPSSQDSDLWRRLALHSRIVHIKEPLIIYYVSDTSITGNPRNRIEGTKILLQKYKQLYEKYPRARVIHINRSIQNYLRSGWEIEAHELFYEEYSVLERIRYSYIFPLGYCKKIIDKYWRKQ